MTFRRAVLTVLLVTSALVLVGAEPALASCHLFTVSAQPSTVNEGSSLTITVTRDDYTGGNSSVLVEAIDLTTSSNDYAFADQRVSFTGTQTSRNILLSTTEDSAVEPNERLRVRLSDPQGCDNGPPLDVGSPVTVTIQNDDQATTTTTRPPTTTTSSTTTSSTTSSTSSTTTSSTTTTTRPSTTTSTTEEETTTTTEEEEEGEGEREEGGGSWMLPIVLGGTLVAALAIALLARNRLGDDDELDEVDIEPDEDG